MKKTTGNEKMYQEIFLAEIQPNPVNPRKNFMGKKFEELVASVKKVGVIEPILVRPVDLGKKSKIKYEIIAGERRFRASKQVAYGNGGIENYPIPAIIQSMSDDDAFDLMTIENLQREDLTELEEAQSFKTYLDKKGKEALPELAERTGIKPSYINCRIAVMNLAKDVLDLWGKGKIKYGHCEQLIRLSDKNEITQMTKDIIDHLRYNDYPVKDLKRKIDERSIPLSKAMFDIEKAGCNTCQSNSKVQRDMFGEETSKILCTGTSCFKKKQNDWLMANWQKDFKPKTGTNGFRFYSDISYDKHNDFDSWVGKPGKDCKECPHLISLIEVGCEIKDKQSCVGDKTCFNRIIASGKKEAKQKANQKSDKKEQSSNDVPRVSWHGEFFREAFYKTRLPEVINSIQATDVNILRLSLMSLFIANSAAMIIFAGSYCEGYNIDEKGFLKKFKKSIYGPYDLPKEDIITALFSLKYDKLLEIHRTISAKVIMQTNTSAHIRNLIAPKLGIDLSKEWRITKEYLEKKTTKEILAMITKFGIDKDTKAQAFLHEKLNKKRGRFDTCKKAELVDIFLKSGIDLSGKVPSEILN